MASSTTSLSRAGSVHREAATGPGSAKPGRVSLHNRLHQPHQRTGGFDEHIVVRVGRLQQAFQGLHKLALDAAAQAAVGQFRPGRGAVGRGSRPLSRVCCVAV